MQRRELYSGIRIKSSTVCSPLTNVGMKDLGIKSTASRHELLTTGSCNIPATRFAFSSVQTNEIIKACSRAIHKEFSDDCCEACVELVYYLPNVRVCRCECTRVPIPAKTCESIVRFVWAIDPLPLTSEACIVLAWIYAVLLCRAQREAIINGLFSSIRIRYATDDSSSRFTAERSPACT